MATFRIGFLVYPNLTQLDLTGPAQILHRMPGAELHYLWKNRDPVPSDCGLALVPTTTLAEAPQLDMICVPGGHGCTAVMADAEVIAWLQRQAAGAKLITSVCTGSLILAAAGLLEGYRAACHWAWGQHLARFGAEWRQERVVVDRNRITGGGVTSGIDFAFRVVEHLGDRDVAESIQLGIEYDPQPLAGGTPDKARPEILARVNAMIADRMRLRAEEIAAVVPPSRKAG
jgi:cyclohexyl-isocyanide hydratase